MKGSRVALLLGMFLFGLALGAGWSLIVPADAQVITSGSLGPAGVGTSGLTTGTIPKGADTARLADSVITESAGAVTVGGSLTIDTRTGTAASFACFDAGGKLVSKATACQ